MRKGRPFLLALLLCWPAYAAKITDTVYVQNEYVTVCVEPSGGERGRFSMGITVSNPAHPAPILDGQQNYEPRNNYLTVEVDREQHPGRDVWYDFGSGDGDIQIQPFASGNKIIAAWETKPDKGSIYIEQTLTLLRDAVRIEYRVKNNDFESHHVRLRLILDLAFGSAAASGGPFATPSLAGITTEREFTAVNMPPYWVAWGGSEELPVILKGILAQGDATPPDYFAIVYWPMAAKDMEYEINPLRSHVADSGVIYWWGPYALKPGEERKVVTYFGLGYADSDYSFPYVLALEAPKTLAVEEAVPGRGRQGLLDDPFTVEGFIYNVSDTAFQDVTLFLSLPEGLEFEPGETAAKYVGRVDQYTEGKASWRVRVTGERTGTLTLTLLATVTPGGSKSVRRTINIPAIPQRSLNQGIFMLSIPFGLLEPDPEKAFDLGGADVMLARWEPTVGEYRFYPDPYFSSVSPGQGFWMKLDLDTTLKLVNSYALPVDQEYMLPLERGWNQIGCPFIYSVSWGMMKVIAEGVTKPLIEAISAGWIGSTLFWYNPETQEYEWSSDPTTPLLPWKGYWVKVMTPCYLVFPPPTLVPPVEEEEALEQFRSPKPRWEITLVAEQGGRKDCRNFIGASPDASNGLDRYDVEEPPLPPCPKVVLRLVRACREGKVRLARDIVREGQRMEWTAEVISPKAGRVSLSWPDLRKAPHHLAFVLHDLSTGRKVWMRTQSVYSYEAGAGEVRTFLIEAFKRPRSSLLIGPARVVRGRGGAILEVNLLESARLTVRLRSPTGRVLSTPIRGRACEAGINRFPLGRLPSWGLMLLEIKAEDAWGRKVRKVVPLAGRI